MTTPDSEEILLTYAQVAEACNVSMQTVYNWTQRGKIIVVPLPTGTPRFPISQFDPTIQRIARRIYNRSQQEKAAA